MRRLEMNCELVPVTDNKQLGSIVERCTKDLLASHRIDVRPELGHTESILSGCGGIVRIAGKQCELSIVLICPDELLAETHPGVVLMRDWAGELTNQLAGRIKHALWNHGAGLVYQTAPAVLDASMITLAREKTRHMAPLHFSANANPVVVMIDGFLDSGLTLEPADVEPYVAEGGVVML